MICVPTRQDFILFDYLRKNDDFFIALQNHNKFSCSYTTALSRYFARFYNKYMQTLPDALQCNNNNGIEQLRRDTVNKAFSPQISTAMF